VRRFRLNSPRKMPCPKCLRNFCNCIKKKLKKQESSSDFGQPKILPEPKSRNIEKGYGRKSILLIGGANESMYVGYPSTDMAPLIQGNTETGTTSALTHLTDAGSGKTIPSVVKTDKVFKKVKNTQKGIDAARMKTMVKLPKRDLIGTQAKLAQPIVSVGEPLKTGGEPLKTGGNQFAKGFLTGKGHEKEKEI